MVKNDATMRPRKLYFELTYGWTIGRTTVSYNKILQR